GNIFGLKRRGRIGHVDLVIDPEFVARAGLHAGDVGGKPAFVAALHCLRFVQQQLHALCCRRPKVERRAVCRRPRTELSLIHAEPAKASTERGGALAPAPAAKSAVVCLASAVLRTSSQLLYSAMTGSLNAISSGAALSTIKIGGCAGSTGPST